jgi:hypothetical protein
MPLLEPESRRRLYAHLNDRLGGMADGTGGGVFGSLTWIDPEGRWWIAAIGSTPPDDPMPAAWSRITIEPRDDLPGDHP